MTDKFTQEELWKYRVEAWKQSMKPKNDKLVEYKLPEQSKIDLKN